jgi:hypothetical protein
VVVVAELLVLEPPRQVEQEAVGQVRLPTPLLQPLELQTPVAVAVVVLV